MHFDIRLQIYIRNLASKTLVLKSRILRLLSCFSTPPLKAAQSFSRLLYNYRLLRWLVAKVTDGLNHDTIAKIIGRDGQETVKSLRLPIFV
jgi:hypothetical protein